MIPAELDHLTHTDLRPFLRRALQSLYLSCEEAKSYVEAEHEPAEAASLFGAVRRAKLEANLRGVAPLTGLVGHVIGSAGTHWKHTEIRTPDESVVMTAARVDRPGAMPPSADYRTTLATDGQLSLLPEPDEQRAESVYALLTYSNSVWDRHEDKQRWRHLPGSAHLAFPNASVRHYVHIVDLFTMFPEVVKASTPAEWDASTLNLYVKRGVRESSRRVA